MTLAKRISNSFLLALCAFSLHLTKAQSLIFKNLNVEHGLPTSEVHHILQDSKGYLWFSTNTGVSQYDGNTFRHFGAKEGLTEQLVFESKEDPKGRIWFRGLTGRFSYYSNDTIMALNNPAALFSGYHIPLSFAFDESEKLWVGGRSDYHVFDIRTGKVMEHPPSPVCRGYIMEVGNNDLIHYQHANKDSDSLLLNFTDKAGKIFRSIKTPENLELPHNSVRFIKRKNGNYLYSADNRLFEISAQKQLINQYVPAAHDIISLFEDREGNIWVGLRNKGVMLYRGGNLLSSPENGLSDNSVTSIAQDFEGGYWFSTLENGLYYLHSTNNYFLDRSNGLANNKVRSLASFDNAIAIAVNNTLTFLQDDKMTQLDLEKYFEGDYVITSLLQTEEDLYVSGTRAGLLKFSRKEKQPTLILENIINAKRFIQLRSGNIAAISPSILQIIRNDSLRQTLPLPHRPNCIFETADGRLLIGYASGIMVISAAGDRYALEAMDSTGLYVNGIAEWNGELLLATDRGLLCSDRKSTKTLSKRILLSDACNDLRADTRNVLWVATNNGLAKIRAVRDSLVFEIFNSGNGLLANQISKLHLAGDLIYAATAKGLMIAKASALQINRTPPPIFINSVTANDLAIQKKTSVELDHTQNYITFNFSGISYAGNGLLRYKYKMEGVDAEWKFSSNTSVQYPTLPPGSYKFVVFAVNNNGVESLEPASFAFSIALPFWRTWWFYLLCSFLAAGVIAAGVWMRVSFLRKKDAVNRRISEIEMKALRSQMNPHFIFNCLGSIQSFILKNDPDSAEKYLMKFSQLIRSVLENSTRQSTTLSEELWLLNLYLELESLRFRNRFVFRIDVWKDLDVQAIEVPTMLIQPYVENAIWHGLMPKDEAGELKISISLKGQNSLSVIVEDNGIGRKRSEQLKSHKAHRTSFGMAVTKERIEILNFQNKLKSSVNVQDLYDAEGQAKGTIVEINIPLTYSYDKSHHH